MPVRLMLARLKNLARISKPFATFQYAYHFTRFFITASVRNLRVVGTEDCLYENALVCVRPAQEWIGGEPLWLVGKFFNIYKRKIPMNKSPKSEITIPAHNAPEDSECVADVQTMTTAVEIDNISNRANAPNLTDTMEDHKVETLESVDNDEAISVIVREETAHAECNEAMGSEPRYIHSGLCSNSDGNAVSPMLIRLSDVEEKPLNWLWENKIPYGNLSLITGIGSAGKSYMTIYMTACITNGRDWADETPCDAGSVLFFYGEDGLEDTYKQRCRINDVRQDRVVFMKGAKAFTKDETVAETNVYLADIDVIERAIRDTAKETGLPVKMVVIDPISNYWGKVNENANTAVRSVLKPLQMLAGKLGIAFVLIQHTGKTKKDNVQQNVLGSTGIVASCRSVWGVYNDPADDSKRLFVPVKNNCGYNHTAVSYQITAPDGKVEILETGLQIKAEEIEAEIAAAKKAATKQQAGAMDRAIVLLSEFLGEGGKPASEVIKTGKAKGFSERTMDRAKKALGISSRKEGNGGWIWELPVPQECQRDLAPL